MRLSWNEIRSRAAEFARKWEGVEYLLGLYEKMMEPLVAKGVRGRRR